MTILKGLLRLTRPANALICGLSVVCGGILAGRPLDRLKDLVFAFYPENDLLSHALELRLLSAAVSATLILAAGNVYNDVCDRACDSINAPHRPIPSGAVKPEQASLFALFLALAGLLLSVPLGVYGIAVAVTAVILLALYDSRLKSVPLAGNSAVAILGGGAFMYGGIAGGSFTRALLPASFAVLFHLGRELIKDSADVEGDRSAGIRTAATEWGTQTACLIGAAVLMILAVTTVLPFSFGYFGLGYFACVTLGVWPVLLCTSISALRDPSEKNLRRISGILKLDMPVGIAAILIGFQGL